MTDSDFATRLPTYYDKTNPAKDPLAMGHITVQAVDQIGEAAAKEIDDAARTVMDSADEVCQRLHNLAASIREHSHIAGQYVSEFVNKTSSVIETVRVMQDQLERGGGNGTNK